MNPMDTIVMFFMILVMMALWKEVLLNLDMKQQKFIMIQEINIYKTTWYKIVGFFWSTYASYKVDSKRRCKFLLHENKGSYKLRTPTK